MIDGRSSSLQEEDHLEEGWATLTVADANAE